MKQLVVEIVVVVILASYYQIVEVVRIQGVDPLLLVVLGLLLLVQVPFDVVVKDVIEQLGIYFEEVGLLDFVEKLVSLAAVQH